jgi:hypothetical protein
VQAATTTISSHTMVAASLKAPIIILYRVDTIISQAACPIRSNNRIAIVAHQATVVIVDTASTMMTTTAAEENVVVVLRS